MATCKTTQNRYFPQDPTELHHLRIIDKDTYTNIADFTWWYGSTHTGSENVADFQGVATHEIGHWARLGHVPDGSCSGGTAIETMCQFVYDLDDDSWRWRSLTSDDVSAVNHIYP